MKSPNITKQLTSWPFIMALCLLIIIGTLAVKLWPRSVPYDQCSDIYKHYAGVEGIDASFIKYFKVNDSVFVDVTLLEAKDSASWAVLMHDFPGPDLSDELQQISICRENLVFTRLISHDDYIPTTTSDSNRHYLLAISPYLHMLTIFHITNDDESHAVYCHNFNKSINSK